MTHKINDQDNLSIFISLVQAAATSSRNWFSFSTKCCSYGFAWEVPKCKEMWKLFGEPLQRPEAPRQSSSVCLQQLCSTQLLQPCTCFSWDGSWTNSIRHPLPIPIWVSWDLWMPSNIQDSPLPSSSIATSSKNAQRSPKSLTSSVRSIGRCLVSYLVKNVVLRVTEPSEGCSQLSLLQNKPCHRKEQGLKITPVTPTNTWHWKSPNI